MLGDFQHNCAPDSSASILIFRLMRGALVFPNYPPFAHFEFAILTTLGNK